MTRSRSARGHWFIGDVDPRGRLDEDTRVQIADWIRTFAGMRIEIAVRKFKSQRSLSQNAWVWGVAYPLIADEIGYDRHEHEDLHYALVAKWGGEHFDKRLGALVPKKRSSKLTTEEFSDYMEWLVRFAAESLNVIVPLPDEAAA